LERAESFYSHLASTSTTVLVLFSRRRRWLTESHQERQVDQVLILSEASARLPRWKDYSRRTRQNAIRQPDEVAEVLALILQSRKPLPEKKMLDKSRHL
jgi:hypothetical protein